jgi:hypothetical protein
MTETPPASPDPDDPDGVGGYDADLDDLADDVTGFEDDADAEPLEQEDGRHRAETSDG